MKDARGGRTGGLLQADCGGVDNRYLQCHSHACHVCICTDGRNSSSSVAVVVCRASHWRFSYVYMAARMYNSVHAFRLVYIRHTVETAVAGQSGAPTSDMRICVYDSCCCWFLGSVRGGVSGLRVTPSGISRHFVMQASLASSDRCCIL